MRIIIKNNGHLFIVLKSFLFIHYLNLSAAIKTNDQDDAPRVIGDIDGSILHIAAPKNHLRFARKS